MGLLFREHPKAQPEGGFRRSPGSNLRPLVYKASDLTTAPRRLLLGEASNFFHNNDYHRLACSFYTHSVMRNIRFVPLLRESLF